MIDLRQSRNTYWEEARWWSRDVRDMNESDELIMKRNESGRFKAKEIVAEQMSNNVVGGSFMIDKTTVTLKTPDNLTGIKNNDLVEFRGEKWIVIDAQKKKAKVQQTYFLKSECCSHLWYLELRK